MKRLLAFCPTLFFFTASCNSDTTKAKISDQIRINQLGYYPASVKQFTIVDTEASAFKVVDAYQNKVFSGDLVDHGTWEASGEKVLMGDFSSFTAPGAYYVVVDDSIASYPFIIKKEIYRGALKAAIKSYYYQRASMAIEEQYGGIYKR